MQVKIKQIKTAQSIKNEQSNLLHCDKYKITYHPLLSLVEVVSKQKNEIFYIGLANVAYMMPLDGESLNGEAPQIAKNTRGNSAKITEKNQLS